MRTSWDHLRDPVSSQTRPAARSEPELVTQAPRVWSRMLTASALTS